MINKQETIAAIMKLNPSATQDFLEAFGDEELALYLNRLNERQKHAREETGWRKNAPLSMGRRLTAATV
jgi:hypothetical protein